MSCQGWASSTPPLAAALVRVLELVAGIPVRSLLKKSALWSDCLFTRATSGTPDVPGGEGPDEAGAPVGSVLGREDPDEPGASEPRVAGAAAGENLAFSRSGSTAKHVPALVKNAKSAAVRGVAPSPTAMKASSSVKPAQSFARNFLYASQTAMDSEISLEFGNSFICSHTRHQLTTREQREAAPMEQPDHRSRTTLRGLRDQVASKVAAM